MNARWTKRSRLSRASLALTFGGWLAITGLKSASQTPAPPNQSPAANGAELRFAVAHQHMGSWCYGYLYVNGYQVRYEVVQPQSDREHSFAADRASVIAGHRTLFGQTPAALMPFINLRVKGRSYNFLWLANESEVRSGGAHRMSPPAAAPPDTLFAAIQNPAPGATAMQQGAATQTPAAGPTSAAVFPGSTNAAAGASMSNTQAPQTPAPTSEPQGDVRFAVAHYHQDGSWCYGYLYVTHDQVRYEVVQPAVNRSHAFAVNRSSVTARLWATHPDALTHSGRSNQDAFELASQGTLYHFRWLANETDVNSGSARPAQPPLAAPPDLLIKTIQTPTARMPWVTPGPSPEPAARFDLAMNQIKRGNPAVWR